MNYKEPECILRRYFQNRITNSAFRRFMIYENVCWLKSVFEDIKAIDSAKMGILW